MAAITLNNVRRTFGDTVALDDITLTVEPHQIFGLLGPNGSGKTTLLNLVQGLDAPTSGSVEVLGLNPLRDHAELVTRLGSQHQESTALPRLTVRETIRLFSSFYPDPLDPDQLISTLSLDDKADTRMEKLSGGQRQRVFIALALIHNPELLLFDELTSALDPHIKRSIWDILKSLREQGHTIVLTTHSMEEAQELCDRVAIIDRGEVLAEGSPTELINEYAPGTTLIISADTSDSQSDLEQIPGVDSVEQDAGQWHVTGTGDFIAAVVEKLSASGDPLTGIQTEQPSLEDVFLGLTGRRMTEVEK